MPTNIPQVLVTLTPDGGLKAELPSNGPSRHSVELTAADAGASLLRILHSQLRAGAPEIGHDGAPTQAQVKHWERHGQWADSRCRFCIAEGRALGSAPKRKRRAKLLAEIDGVQVRRLAPKGPSASARADKTAEEMGL